MTAASHPPPQRPCVVLNPKAAGGQAESRWEGLEPLLRKRFPALSVLRTTRPGEESALARKAVEEGSDLVVAAGGDGTLSGVVDGLMSATLSRAGAAERPSFAVLPVGTGSDFARGHELPREAEAVAPRIASGSPRELDVGRLTFLGENPPRVRHWINQSYVGFGANVVRRVNASKGRRTESAYTRAVFPELLHFHREEVRFSGPSAPTGPFGLSNLVVALGRYSGGGMLSSPRSDPSDGAFDMIAVGPVSRLRLLTSLSKFRTGRHLDLKVVTTWKASLLSIDGSAQPAGLVEADGDIVGALPARYELLPRALAFWG